MILKIDDVVMTARWLKYEIVCILFLINVIYFLYMLVDIANFYKKSNYLKELNFPSFKLIVYEFKNNKLFRNKSWAIAANKLSKTLSRRIQIYCSTVIYWLTKLVKLPKLRDFFASYKSICDNFSIDLIEFEHIFGAG